MLQTLLQALIDDNKSSPWIGLGFVIVAIAYIAHYVITFNIKSAKDRSNEMQSLIAGNACPEKLKSLMTASMEGRAFELATGYPARPKEREALIKLFRNHKEEITPRDLGRALPYLKIDGQKINIATTSYYFGFFSAWSLIIYFGFLFILVSLVMVIYTIGIKDLSILILMLAAFSSFLIYGVIDAYNLRMARKIQALASES